MSKTGVRSKKKKKEIGNIWINSIFAELYTLIRLLFKVKPNKNHLDGIEITEV